MSSRIARAYATFAFGPGAAIYAFLVDHDAWRRDVRAMARLVSGQRVLDLGIGPGASALALAAADPARRPIGLDRSRQMLRRAAAAAAAARVRLPLVRADAGALPLRPGALDGATGHSVLYLLPDPAAALVELRAALRPGGRVAFLEPRAGPLPARALRGGVRVAAAMLLWRGMSRLHRRFTEAGLAALLDAAGFRAARAWPVLRGFGVMATAERP
ncbi:class I SAM-dependent methyltransferase [Anaeromyxobacter oryzisoli]|uniref:class I SAM-dependent methyltransferase n=1 Tax=Anaeromyxobacter oryzisoli TaxID=2925408 RepID=UPI001F5A4299|nr:methyltransferase domain-containing protein [Anaeromyxobacter sp. SG63]